MPSRALLAWIFMFAREGIAKNMNTAIELVQEGARLGCHHCQGVLAYCLWKCHDHVVTDLTRFRVWGLGFRV
jgi:hypothetical protein